MKTKYQYIHFVQIPNPNRKTSIWKCLNNRSLTVLGTIKWDTGWRQYVYETPVGMGDRYFFSSGCLDDISDFIKQLTHARKVGEKRYVVPADGGIWGDELLNIRMDFPNEYLAVDHTTAERSGKEHVLTIHVSDYRPAEAKSQAEVERLRAELSQAAHHILLAADEYREADAENELDTKNYHTNEIRHNLLFSFGPEVDLEELAKPYRDALAEQEAEDEAKGDFK